MTMECALYWPVEPMEPVLLDAPFDGGDTLFEVKWDGVRVLAYRYPDGVRLFNRRLHERTAQYPELCRALSGLPAGTVLDGEVIAPDEEGKPDFPWVLRRDLATSPATVAARARIVPVRYMVFDILWRDGRALHSLPLVRRQEALEGLPLPEPLIRRVDSVPAAGKALFEAVAAEGLEGIVAKKADSPYLPGRKSPLWRKIKCLRSLELRVGGYSADEGGRLRSLLVGLEEEKGLRYLGSAASGLTGPQREALAGLFAGMAGPCPFVNPPAAAGIRWVQPLLPVRVRFLEYTPQGVMRNPVVTGLGADAHG